MQALPEHCENMKLSAPGDLPDWLERLGTPQSPWAVAHRKGVDPGWLDSACVGGPQTHTARVSV